MNKKMLLEMEEALKKASVLYRPSNYWVVAGSNHTQQLFQGGFDNFKRSVNLKYFGWGILGILRHQLFPVISELGRKNLAPVFKSYFINPKSSIHSTKKGFNMLSRIMYPESLDAFSAFIYRVYTAFLWDYVSREDKLHILDTLQEPRIGNPFLISYKKRAISQDICNSVHEFYSITKKIDVRKHMDIAELGAGYGRLAYVFLKAMPKASYTIFDIPPALFISQKYIRSVFPKEKIFYYRHFESFKEIKKEFESARIRFLMAHQIEYLPDKYFDHMLTVSTLHEMTREQIRNYLFQIDRLTKGYFYTKQWKKSLTKDNDYITEKEYPIPKEWKTIFQRRHPIQSMFFEALYKIS